MLFSFYTSLLAAILHVISGPDHLAAVTPLAIEKERKAWKVGLLWGFGHLSSMLVIGALFYNFREFIPIESISAYSERLVGLVLIAVGVWAFYKVSNTKSDHTHVHVHAEPEPFIHSHGHHHKKENHIHSHQHAKSPKQGLFSAYGIGLLHGLAGLSHFILLSPIMSFEEPINTIMYLVGFAAGTLVAMSVYAFVLGQISKASGGKNNKKVFNSIRLAGGAFAVLVGIYWSYLGIA
ncbi:MAG: sulfite exporter TauE/SafE family protein [Fulvivirga sp.]